jgi:hypothetical protein
MFSSAGQKEASVSTLRIGNDDIVSVEFGGYSGINNGSDAATDDDSGGDLRVMGIDVRHQRIGEIDGYLVSVVLSDSAVKVTRLVCWLTVVVLLRSCSQTGSVTCIRKVYHLLPFGVQLRRDA